MIAPGNGAIAGLRWGIYCRISVERGEKGDDDFVSLETQEVGCRRLIARVDPGGIVVGQYVIREVHTGVELFERQHLASLREGIRRREIDAVAVFQPKRLSRDPDHASYLKTEAEYHGVKYRFALDDHGDSDAGALLNYLEHWTGKKEHKDITERTMRARVALVHGGRAWTGCRKAPYGLRWTFRTETKADGRQIQKRDRWEEDPDTGPIVRWLFGEALKGTTQRRMGLMLQERGVPAPYGGRFWAQPSVRHILRSRVYTGKAASLRSYTDEADTYISKKGRKVKRRKIKAEADWVALPEGYAPALVDQDTFDAVQRLLASNKDRAGRRAKHPGLSLMGGGRTKCGPCGGTMSPRHRAKGERSKQPRILCQRRDRPHPGLRPAIACHILDDAVRKVARLIYEHPEVIREQAELHRREDPATADLEMVERTLLDLERRIQSVALAAENLTSPEAAATLAVRLEALTDQKKKAQQERRELLDRRAGWEAAQQVLDSIVALCGRVKGRLASFTHEEWQDAIDALGITATVWPEGSESRFKIRVRLEGLLTTEMLKKLTPEFEAVGAELIRTC